MRNQNVEKIASNIKFWCPKKASNITGDFSGFISGGAGENCLKFCTRALEKRLQWPIATLKISLKYCRQFQSRGSNFGSNKTIFLEYHLQYCKHTFNFAATFVSSHQILPVNI